MAERFSQKEIPETSREFWPLKFVPNKLKPYFAKGVLTVSALMAFTAACEAGDREYEGDEVEPRVEREIDPEDIQSAGDRLIFPFQVENGNFNIQQGWNYLGIRGNHNAIDFIDGGIGESKTWRQFNILAAASGEACVNPPNRIGDAIFIKHNINGESYHTYYGHISSARENMPNCSSNNRLLVKQGEFIGTAGDSGVEGLTHLHFQVNGPRGNPVDPFDIYSTREDYPDVGFTNGNLCGENHLWEYCPTEPTVTPTMDVKPDDIEGEFFGEENIGGYFTARKMMEEWIGHMMAGRVYDAFDMQVAQDERIEGTRYNLVDIEKLRECSDEMRRGEFRDWEIYQFREKSYQNKYSMRVEGNFNEYIAGERYEGYYGDNIYFDFMYIVFEEDSLKNMKIAELPICVEIGTPFGKVVSQQFNEIDDIEN